MEEASLRSRLELILRATTSASDLPPTGYWVGDVAGERQVQDDRASGRVSWKTAHDNAREGLAALDEGRLDLAEHYAWSAVDFLLAAFEARMRPSDWEVLGRPSQRRGRPRGSPNVKGRN